VVDENRADLEIARKALSQSGFHSEIAATATEALGKVRAAQGSYAAVVIDDGPSTADADRLFRSLRRLHRDLPIVITSRSRAAELASRYDDDSCVSALAKPYTQSQLLEALLALRVRCRGEG
jgi:CheY-like chemotaxis protein